MAVDVGDLVTVGEPLAVGALDVRLEVVLVEGPRLVAQTQRICQARESNDQSQ